MMKLQKTQAEGINLTSLQAAFKAVSLLPSPSSMVLFEQLFHTLTP